MLFKSCKPQIGVCMQKLEFPSKKTYECSSRCVIHQCLFVSIITENYFRCGFRLPQRSHLRTMKNFVIKKSWKRCEKSGKHGIKLGNWEILKRFIFPVSAPVLYSLFEVVSFRCEYLLFMQK